MLSSPNPGDLERILTIGGYNAGKTYMWLTIARRAQQTGSDAKFYALDTDNAIPRMLSDEAFKGLTNIERHVPDNWTDYVAYLDKYTQQLRVQDWLILDMASYPWEAVQAFEIESRYGKDYADHMLDWAIQQTPGEKKGAPALNRDVDWNVINAMYKTKFQEKIIRAQGNVYAATQAKVIDAREKDPGTLAIFGPYGVKPEGQKHLGHIFHTVLLADEAKSGARRLTTIKDRSREKLQGQEAPDFTINYLRSVAGWTL